MRIHAILNRNAGTIIGAGAEVFEQKLAETFKNAGHDITVETVEPKQIGGRFRDAAERDYDALIIGGGDGSVNAAAAVLLDHRTALGILPLGTMNRLARDLGLSADVDAALPCSPKRSRARSMSARSTGTFSSAIPSSACRRW